MLGSNVLPSSGQALASQPKRKRASTSTKPQFQVLLDPQHRHLQVFQTKRSQVLPNPATEVCGGSSKKPQFKIPIGPQHRLWRTSITDDGLCLFRNIDTFMSSSRKGPKYYQTQLLKFMEATTNITRILAAVNEFRRKTSDDPQAAI